MKHKKQIDREQLKEFLFSHTNKEASHYFDVAIRTIVRYRKIYELSNSEVKYPTFVPLTQLQKEIIDGCLLGDGSIHKKLRWFQIGQKIQSKEYVDWLFQVLLPYSRHAYKDKTILREKPHYSWRFYTYPHQIFTDYRSKWYPNNKKVIPSDLVITPTVFTHWIVQDGTNNQGKKAISIATNCFSVSEVRFLIKLLFIHLGIKATLHRNKKKQPVIYIGAFEYIKTIELLRKYIVWDCFKYKIDTSKTKLKTNKNLGGNKLNMVKAEEIRKLKSEGVSINELAKKYKVVHMSIRNILNNKTYKRDTASISVTYNVGFKGPNPS